ncbi:hypothetical protein KST_04782 [Mycobacterium marinum]|nr:hypothetical protein KST_04782 [Mycobacterium marinum]
MKCALTFPIPILTEPLLKAPMLSRPLLAMPSPPNRVIGSVGVKSGLMLLIPKFSVPLLKKPTLP